MYHASHNSNNVYLLLLYTEHYFVEFMREGDGGASLNFKGNFWMKIHLGFVETLPSSHAGIVLLNLDLTGIEQKKTKCKIVTVHRVLIPFSQFLSA